MIYSNKKNYPLDAIRRHLETGPIVLVTSKHGGKTNIMTMGWHMMLEFEPALFGCCIVEANDSYALIRASRECVINVPTVELIDTVVAVGNSHGGNRDKFEEFGLTARKAKLVGAPLIDECYASFECRLHDGKQIDRYGLFIWQVVKAHVAPVRSPRTIHYRGEGEFMVAGKTVSRRSKFRPENL